MRNTFTAFAIQQTAINNCINKFTIDEVKRLLLVAPTGSGKTFMGIEIFKQLKIVKKANKLIVCVPFQPLIAQVYFTCVMLGLKVAVYHGTIRKGVDSNGITHSYNMVSAMTDVDVIITLPDTFAGYVAGETNYGFPKHWVADMALFDEVHKNTSKNSQALRDFFEERLAQNNPDKKLMVLGLSATPRRETNKETGEELSEWFEDNIVNAGTGKDMVDAGRIVAPKYFEYEPNTENVIERWLEISANHTNKSTIVVCSNLFQAYMLTKSFVEDYKVSAKIITSDDIYDPEGDPTVPVERQQSESQRLAIQDEFRQGKFTVLVSVGTICEGFDAPIANFVIIEREITAMALYFQIVGRVLRTYTSPTGEVKAFGNVLDFGGNKEKYGCILDKKWEVDDFGPESPKAIESNATIPSNLAKRAKRITVKCEKCLTQYNAKKRACCPNNACGTAHSITVTTTKEEQLLEKYSISVDFFKEMHPTLLTYCHTRSIEIPGYELNENAHSQHRQMRSILNSHLGANVFDVKTGGVLPDHKELESLILKPKSMKQQIVVPL